MGCGNSKPKESKLIALCRERTELIRAARDRRYALAAAHAAYFRALAAVGDAFRRFVQEELAPAPASPPPGSPFLILPSSESKGKKSGSDRGSDVAAASTSSPVTPLSHSLSPEGSHLPLSSGSESEMSPQDGGGKGNEAVRKAGRKAGSGGGGKGEDSSSPDQHFLLYGPNSSIMRSSTAIPTLVYQDPFPPPWSYSAYNGYGYGYGHPPYGVPIGSSPKAREDMTGSSTPMVAPGTPPPPPPPETSSWDFFDPFNSYEEFLPDYSGGRYGARSSISSPDLNEVRKQEGIPELEEEAEVEPMEEKEKKVVVDDLGWKDPIIGSSNTVSTQEIDGKDEKVGGIGLAEKESRSNSAGSKSRSRSTSSKSRSRSAGSKSRSNSVGSKVRSSGEDERSNGKKKRVTLEDISYVTEESAPSNEKLLSAHSGRQPLLVRGTRDVMEVVQEIEEHFRSAAACGEELSRMLEVGKLPYQLQSRMYRVISSRILDAMSLPLLIPLRPSLSRYSTESTRRKASNADAERSGNLSSTLEKLYVWEKKLCKEVQDEEKVRVRYDKKYKRLKALDDRGAENSKIDLTWASVRKLGTKISIIIKSVDAISSRMHKIRDEELQPQLIELIQGFIRMWKSVLDCHQKQLQALVDCKSQSLVVKTTRQNKSAAKATKELELELLKWCKCFNDWIRIQKSYIEALNGWLMKWLPQEQEQTPDGPAPFSPSKIGAPSAFIVSNDWYHAIKTISVEKVIERMHAFTEIIHTIWESQDEERRQRLEEEHLSRVFDRRIKSTQVTQTNGHLQILTGHEDSLEHHNYSLMALDTMRKRLDEKRSIHKETLKRLQEATSSILPTGLVPIFEDLGTFTSEAMQVYNGIRTSSDSGGT